ncbi:Crp/Fnr family transcriptional regulator [Tenacibaculum finnmarkense genomovar ulcerans]|uniref:Crp/Fnr family transcriptional regulator n=1 Tax=Tenacibaculum finnmarkense TaxID=2781243 RepID=UPI001E551CB4|nr:Crp/Fnr family transcriptional regulator [Tenacibaculum finnmarkense]MCD8453263.1 Crp/Fnr family transcriptional regulator [Tenacibaculum finnmarkense genomovar ulcerans]
MLPKKLLLEQGATIKSYKKGEFIFNKGNTAKHYYQIISGEIKMNNFNDDGKEFTQGVFKKGESFGEPPLFTNRVYPANAEVLKNVEILILPKENFIKLMNIPNIGMEMLTIFSKRLYYKSLIAVEISSETPEHRVLSLFDYLKKYNFKKETSNENFKIDFTRQEIANLTGLRVETVIRSIKNLENKEKIIIINRKVYL